MDDYKSGSDAIDHVYESTDRPIYHQPQSTTICKTKPAVQLKNMKCVWTAIVIILVVSLFALAVAAAAIVLTLIFPHITENQNSNEIIMSELQALQSLISGSNITQIQLQETRLQLNSSILDHRMELLNSNQDLFTNFTKAILIQQNLFNLKIQALQLRLNNIDTLMDTLQLQLQNSSQEIQKISLQLNQEISKLNISDLQAQINSNIGDIHTLKMDLNDSERNFQTLLNTRMQSLESQVSQSNQSFQSQLREFNEEFRSQLDNSILNLQIQLLNSNQALFTNFTKVIQMQQNLSDLEIQALQLRFNDTETLLDTLQSQLQNASQETQRTQAIQAQLTSNDLEIQALQSEVANLSQECPGSDSSQPATSCQQVLNCNASSSSGSYWIQLEDGSTAQRYCNMNRACGGKAGGWMRVAMLDMRESSNQCPSGLRERVHQSGPGRLCGINLNNGGCSQVFFPTNLHYDQVCGKIIAYQFGSPDAVSGRSNPTIDDNYLDGISLSHSNNPRKHIWSFIASVSEGGAQRTSNCPCAQIHAAASASAPYEFIGNHYFCDTGSTDTSVRSVLYADDPLWDGAGCGPANTCCSLNNPPWFFKQLYSSISEDIEMRVCCNEVRDNEDVRIQQIEIYVR